MKKWGFPGIWKIVLLIGWLYGTGFTGSTGMAFLKVGVDARAVGMGEAYTAFARDAAATFWNPAGLAGGAHSTVFFHHNQWIQGIRGEMGALALVRRKSAWGFHVRSFNVYGIEVRDRPTTEPLEETSAHYLSAGISYARRLSQSFHAGVTVKYLYEKIFVESAGGWAVDVGATYLPGITGLRLAATLQNLGKMNRLYREATALPVLARIGVVYRFPWEMKTVKVQVAGDGVYVMQEGMRFHVGSELLFLRQLAIRMGGMFGYETHTLNFGAGLVRSSFRLDYAIVPFNNDLGVTHRFSVAFRL